jgi:hypothetical protein
MGATAGSLRETIAPISNDTPMLWQYYTAEHAAIPEAHFEAVAHVLQNSPVFLEELHQFMSDWLELTNKRLIEELGEDNAKWER